LFVDHQSHQPEGYPYVFVPPARYDYIQSRLRATGMWTYSDSRLKVVNNFGRDFGLILHRAGIEDGEFHDLRRTAICNWFEEGMNEAYAKNCCRSAAIAHLRRHKKSKHS